MKIENAALWVANLYLRHFPCDSSDDSYRKVLPGPEFLSDTLIRMGVRSLIPTQSRFQNFGRHFHGWIVSWCSVGFEDRPILTTASVPRGSVSLVMPLRSSLNIHPFRKYLEIIFQRQGWRRRAGGQKNTSFLKCTSVQKRFYKREKGAFQKRTKMLLFWNCTRVQKRFCAILKKKHFLSVFISIISIIYYYFNYFFVYQLFIIIFGSRKNPKFLLFTIISTIIYYSSYFLLFLFFCF